MNLQEIKRQVEGKEPIRVRGILKKREETLLNFLTKFFTRWNEEESGHDTIYVDSEEIQTEAGKRRSFGDLYLISKYYYPRMTIEQFRDVMCGDLFTAVPRLRTSWCEATQQRMWYQGTDTQPSGIMNRRKHDEFGNTWNQLKEAQ